MKVQLSPLTLLFFALYLLMEHDLTLVASLSAIMIHELIHLMVLHICKGRATRLTVTPLGLSIHRIGLLSYGQEMALSLSAPLGNLLLAGIFAGFRLNFCAVTANLSFGLLNLLPIYPLDGAKALRAVLSRHLQLAKTEWLCHMVSMACLLLLWLLSVGIALLPGENLSPLILCVALFSANLSLSDSPK